jgi:muramoyltetrapeptide carboxypeptidase
MIPVPLKSGDRIEIVSPASSLVPEKIELATRLLEDQGYKVTLSKHLFDHTEYLAGSDEDRAKDVKAVYCSRGGYGCARLFPYLDLDAMAASGKMFLGFSDITTLHLALNRRGLVTYHAPMALTFSRERDSWVNESFLNALKGADPIPKDSPVGETIIGGQVEGEVTGGCLCLITDSIGTPNAIDCRGKIVLIEDVDENPHRVDAMLTQLLNVGDIQDCAGIVVGEMTGTDEREDASIGKRPWREIVIERLAPLGKPMVLHYPFGHCSQMLTLPLGMDARLNADTGRLSYVA